MSSIDPTTAAVDLPTCETLVQALREELQEHGHLLGLVCEQQQCILRRDSEALTRTSQEIEQQVGFSDTARLKREEQVEAIAINLSLNEATPLREIIPAFPASRQPMLQTLIDEINQSIGKTRHRLQQNRGLLQRLQSVNEELLNRTRPGRSTTYQGKGNVSNTLHTAGVSVEATA